MLFASRVPFDGIHILDCAGTNDMRTVQFLHDDLLHECRIETETCGRRRDFFGSLRRLADRCVTGYRPVLHIDAHGSQRNGLQIGSDMVSWAELCERLTRINAATGNNLGVVLAACHGMHGLEAVDLMWPCPFAYMVGAAEEVSQGALQASMSRFYRSLVTSCNLSKATEAMGTGFMVIRSAEWFYLIFKLAYLATSVGRAGQEKVETLVTRAVIEGVVRDEGQLAVVRKVLRFNNRHPEQTYRRIGAKFLHRQLLVPFDEFIKSIRDSTQD